MKMGLIYSVMVVILLVISVIDVREKLINGKALLLLLLGGFAAILFNHSLSIINAIGAMLIVFTVLWLIHYLSKGSIGMGDVKLCATIALYLGIEKAFSMLLLSMVMCGIGAVMLVIFYKGYRDVSIPFAPFAAAGTIAALLL